MQPGDGVEKDQVLARMDGREIRWELGTLSAELKHAEKEHDTALAAQDTASAQLARLDSERLQLEIGMLEERLGKLDVRSPIQGVVISGDPKESEGARLSMGETILEIGLMDDVTVELAIADEDVSYVKPGQSVRFRLIAQPHVRHEGEIVRIHPRSEQRGTANVFVADVKLLNPDSTLRPGMEGTARVTTARHPLAWNLFHKAWHSVRYRLGW